MISITHLVYITIPRCIRGRVKTSDQQDQVKPGPCVTQTVKLAQAMTNFAINAVWQNFPPSQLDSVEGCGLTQENERFKLPLTEAVWEAQL